MENVKPKKKPRWSESRKKTAKEQKSTQIHLKTLLMSAEVGALTAALLIKRKINFSALYAEPNMVVIGCSDLSVLQIAYDDSCKALNNEMKGWRIP